MSIHACGGTLFFTVVTQGRHIYKCALLKYSIQLLRRYILQNYGSD